MTAARPEPPDPTPATLEAEPETAPTRRERLANQLERWLDTPMAVLSVGWALLVAYQLVAPATYREELATANTVLWLVFLVEFVVRLVVSGSALRYLRRRWPSLLFLVLPTLRLARLVPAARALRLLPAARVVGTSYRALGTARNLLGGRLVFLSAATVIVVFSGGQLLYLLEGGATGASLGDALWWSANLAVSGSYLFEPVTVPGRIAATLLSFYAVVVFASLAASLGAFFMEARAEQAAAEDDAGGTEGAGGV